ncbi:uncharacterized protein B0H64DRAFT_228647 [Chaetomium fimeti]|uniref:SRR1-like domain-containing protein n=1 Tax=Chaetomium fimeti TaxID=1854472 RepID=A0AAE0LNY1_9PEZI|nr:hypothetical protein B0H64DRAFT_228647 [Chaetomium fimeti]
MSSSSESESESESDCGDEQRYRWYPFHVRFEVETGPPTSLDERREAQLEAHRFIQAKYDAGVPFITKDLLRDVVRQLEEDGNDTLSITGLNGVAVDYPIETGKENPHPMCGPGYICIMKKLVLEYRILERLLTVVDPKWFMPRRAYLPVKLSYIAEIRNRETDEVVSFAPPSDYATASRKFEQAKQSLEGSELFAQFKSTLASVTIPPGINKIVALGCSTMAWPNEARAMTSMTQHILALTIRDFLASGYATEAPGESRPEIKCYAQDPMYTPTDEQVLGEAGFTLVDDPRAFLEIDEASVVISVYPDIPVRQIVADIARPAVMIWNRPRDPDPEKTYTDPESPRVYRMLEEYIELPFPPDWSYEDIAIYVRKTTE